MITNTGKSIIAKYLIGDAPSYAGFLALGCGAKPRPNITQIAGASTVSSGALVTVSSTDGLWVGAKVTKVSGTGSLSALQDTLVTAINSDTTFTISPAPTTTLSSATLAISIDPNKQSLDFEMFRVPITSRGYVNDDGVNKIVLTAQLPTEERYEISEIGLFSAGANANAGAFDSRTITTFSNTEDWVYNTGSSLISPEIGNPTFPEITTSLIDELNVITSSADVIQTNSNNGAFLNATRASRYERCRYQNNIFLMRGNTSHLYVEDGVFEIAPDAKFLQITGETVDLTRNSSSDILKVAFSLVSVNGDSGDIPNTARLMIEFSNSDGSEYARMEVNATNAQYRFATNRYIVASSRLGDLTYSSANFSWRNVNTIKVYSSVIEELTVTNKELTDNVAILTTASTHGLSAGDVITVTGVDSTFNGTYVITGTPTTSKISYAKTAGNVSETSVTPNGLIEASVDTFFLVPDAIRLDNVSTINPLYGMTGYSIVQNADEETIIKSPNTNNYIEFRFILDVA